MERTDNKRIFVSVSFTGLQLIFMYKAHDSCEPGRCLQNVHMYSKAADCLSPTRGVFVNCEYFDLTNTRFAPSLLSINYFIAIKKSRNGDFRALCLSNLNCLEEENFSSILLIFSTVKNKSHNSLFYLDGTKSITNVTDCSFFA